jgi:hypothetical protein
MDSRWEPDASLQPPDVLRIVLLPGRGHGDESATAAGVTRRGPQGQGIWLYPRAIAESLGLQLSAQHLWRAGDERAYRRTLGFVLTHELLHCLAGAKHSPTGIMVPHLSLGGLAPSSGIPLDLFPPLRRGVQRLALGLATVPHDDEQAAAPSAGDDAVFGP